MRDDGEEWLLHDLLALLVEEPPSPVSIAEWTREERAAAGAWAAAYQLHSMGFAVRVPPCPSFLELSFLTSL